MIDVISIVIIENIIIMIVVNKKFFLKIQGIGEEGQDYYHNDTNNDNGNVLQELFPKNQGKNEVREVYQLMPL